MLHIGAKAMYIRVQRSENIMENSLQQYRQVVGGVWKTWNPEPEPEPEPEPVN